MRSIVCGMDDGLGRIATPRQLRLALAKLRITSASSILPGMKFTLASCALLAFALLCVSSELLAAQNAPRSVRFEQFPVEVYHGRAKIPGEFHKDSQGDWNDEMGKPASRPRVNFAGEYYLAAHSCGTCCRYYTLDSLRTGAGINQVRMFDAGDSPPVTRDGHAYVPILFSKPNSTLLVVQYELDPCAPEDRNLCRERYFVLKGGELKAILKTLPYCTNEGTEQN